MENITWKERFKNEWGSYVDSIIKENLTQSPRKPNQRSLDKEQANMSLDNQGDDTLEKTYFIDRKESLTSFDYTQVCQNISSEDIGQETISSSDSTRRNQCENEDLEASSFLITSKQIDASFLSPNYKFSYDKRQTQCISPILRLSTEQNENEISSSFFLATPNIAIKSVEQQENSLDSKGPEKEEFRNFMDRDSSEDSIEDISSFLDSAVLKQKNSKVPISRIPCLEFVYSSKEGNKDENRSKSYLTLNSYQEISISWMLYREQLCSKCPLNKKSIEDPFSAFKGGIVVDETGHEIIIIVLEFLCRSLYLSRSSNDQVLPTLLISSQCVLWEKDIRCKTNLKVFFYHGKDSKEIKNPCDFLAYDVVITTYGMLIKKDGKENIYEITSKTPRELKDSQTISCSKLHSLHWQRIILDEAHTISNSKTAKAKSAYQLKAYSRWCLGDNLIQNNEKYLLSLLFFLQVPKETSLESAVKFLLLGHSKSLSNGTIRKPVVSLSENCIK